MLRYWLLILLFCVQCNFLIAQEETRTILPDTIDVAEGRKHPQYEYWKKDYYDNIKSIDKLDQPNEQAFSEMITKYQTKEFEYVESISDKISIWKSILDWIDNFLGDLFPKIEGNPGQWFYNLLGVLGAAFVLFLLYKFFFSGRQFISNPKEETSDEQNAIAFVEKNLLDLDINNYIKQAVATNNYALAIRYLQLLNIQLLAKKDIFTWDQTKTNLELMDEIKQDDIKQDFKRCSALFDYVWFGDFEVNSEKFESISKTFNEFQRRWS